MANQLGIFISSESSDTTDDDEPGPRFTVEPLASLPFLPDDCLLAIMRFLGPVDLNNLSRISDRMKVLVNDKSLWKRVDFRPHKLTSSQLLQYLKYFNHTTTYIATQGFVCRCSGNHGKRRVITARLLRSISLRCDNLETLVLESVAFELSLGNFPPTLTHLSLKRCVVMGLDTRQSYFQGMQDILPMIKVLILSYCLWVSPHDFMAISKCTRLEELKMNGCPQLGECVAYTSLAARFGFPSLKILDLRNTRMGDSDVSCFSHTLTLTQLYLQDPSSNRKYNDTCSEPTCLCPFNDNFTESTDDEDETTMSPIISRNKTGSRIWFPPPVFHTNSSPESPRQSERKHDRKNDYAFPHLRNENERGVENGAPNLPQASTSRSLLNPAGPAPVQFGQKRIRARKRRSGYSGSSSDDNSSTSQLNVINTSTSDTDIVDSSGMSIDDSSSPEKNLVKSKITGHASTKHKRQCSEADSVLNNNIVPRPMHAYPSNYAVAGCSSSVQQIVDFPPPNHIIIISSSSSEANSESGSSEVYKACGNLPFHMPANINFNNSASNSRFHPNFYHLADCEPSTESTITDMCIMSYVLEDIEANRVGYVRIASPQVINARSQLHTLVVRNYRMITDASLQYLLNLPSLRYLDVTGTSVTEGGVLQFKLRRPDVHVVCDFENLPI